MIAANKASRLSRGQALSARRSGATGAPGLAALACLFGASVAPAAFAQQAPPPGSERPAGVLEEVVVSAQFRTEKLQTTPIAITAFTAENLDARGVLSVTDISAFVPNAVIQPLGAGWGATAAAFIRGVGLGDNILSFEPGVPIYVDDVYNGRPQGTIFDLLDLERVEVLRGPQGTLFGKNAIGGTVRLISKKPTGDGTGSASVTVGSYHRIDARATADFTLVPDRVFARIAFSSKKADGWFDVLDYICVHGPNSLGIGGPGLPNGPYGVPGVYPGGLPGIHLQAAVAPGAGCVVDTLNDQNVQSGRAAVRFLINDGVELNVIGDLTSQRQKGPADKYTVIDGTNGLNQFWNGVFVAPVYGAGVGWDNRFVTNSTYTNYSSYSDPLTGRSVPNINNMDHWGISATLDWKVSDAVSLKSVTGYRSFWNKYGRDSDGSPLPNNFTYDDARHRQFSEEITLTGTAGALDWAAGAFYYDAHDSDRGFDVLYPTVIYQNDGFDRQDTTNWALFVHGVYHFTDQLSLTGGVRYTDDKKDATIYRANFFGGVIIPDQYVPLKANNTDFSLSLDYKWSNTLMTYLKYATGFKGGGFSPRPATALQTTPFKPEYLKTLELGSKSELMDRRVRLNAALFFSRYTDQQVFSQQFDSSGANWFREINAGKARIWGLEAELQAEPVDNLRIDGSFGYINYDLYDNGGNGPPFGLLTDSNCNGERCYSPRTPELNGAVGVQYAMHTDNGTITPRLDTQYQSKIYFTTNNQGPQDGYWLLNGRITWAAHDNKWEASLYGRNLTDKEYFNGKLSLIGFFGREQGNPGAPREWGLTIKRNF